MNRQEDGLKLFARGLAIAGLVAALATGVLLAPSAQAHPTTSFKSISVAHLSASGQRSGSALVAAASPYVHVRNHIAVVDPAINQQLSQREVALVESAVSRYNALPLEVKQGTPQSVSPDLVTGGGGGCTPSITVQQQWWGYTYFMNDCFLQLLKGVYKEGIAAITSLAVVAGLAAPLAAAVAAILALAAVSAFAMDDTCGDRGVFLNDVTLTSPFSFYLAPVC